MLRILTIAPDREVAEDFHRAVAGSMTLSIVREVHHYPTALDLARLVRACAPEAVFLTVETAQQAVALVSHLEEILPGVQVVASGRSCTQDTLLTLMRLGVREFLPAPIDAAAARDCSSVSVRHCAAARSRMATRTLSSRFFRQSPASERPQLQPTQRSHSRACPIHLRC